MMATSENGSAPPSPIESPTPASILVVDDEFDLRFVTRLLLEAAGHFVTEAINGRDALAQIHASCPDLLLTDIDMPGMNGVELLDRIRDDHALDGLRIIAWNESPPDHPRADVVLSKGLGIRELESHIKRLLEGDRHGPTQHR